MRTAIVITVSTLLALGAPSSAFASEAAVLAASKERTT